MTLHHTWEWVALGITALAVLGRLGLLKWLEPATPALYAFGLAVLVVGFGLAMGCG